LAGALAANRLPETVRLAEPGIPLYAHLRRALAQYRELADDPATGPAKIKRPSAADNVYIDAYQVFRVGVVIDWPNTHQSSFRMLTCSDASHLI
jgi:hypothetical protein